MTDLAGVGNDALYDGLTFNDIPGFACTNSFDPAQIQTRLQLLLSLFYQ